MFDQARLPLYYDNWWWFFKIIFIAIKVINFAKKEAPDPLKSNEK